MQIQLKLTFLAIVVLASGCAHVKYNSQVIRYEGANEEENTKPFAKKVKIYEEQIPEGYTLKNNVLEVDGGFKGKKIVLGRIQTAIDPGMNLNTLQFNSAVNKEEMTGFQKYCYYTPLNWVIPYPFTLFNLFAYPCFFTDDRNSNKSEDIAFRKANLSRELQSQAVKLGADAVIGVTYGGHSLVAVKTGAVVATREAWTASGFAVKNLQ
jgi:hypothetical protein